MNLLKTIYRKLVVTSTFVIISQPIYSNWDAREHIIDSQSNKSELNDKKFINLKAKVTDFLKNSWCSQEKTELLMEVILLEKPRICVEVGVFTGSTILPVASTLKFIGAGTVYAIDPWSNYEAIKDLSDLDPNKKWWGEVNMNGIYSQFKKMKKKWKLESQCKTIRKTSAEAVDEIGDIDFLHLDGNCSRRINLEDAKSYIPKVRKGGLIFVSNLWLSIGQELFKLDMIQHILDHSSFLCDIENGNSALFKKN